MRSSVSVRRWLALALLSCSTPPPPPAAEAAPALVPTADSPGHADAPPGATASPAAQASSSAASPVPARGAEAAPSPATLAPGAAPTPAPDAAPAADTSLALPVYRAAGVPDVARPWTPDDYERCLHVFAELARSGRSDLPRHGSPRSGALFARLVAVENFEATARAAAGPGERARALERQLQLFPGVLQAYSPASDGVDFSAEQAELTLALLELLKSALASSRELVARDATWGETYARQKAITLGVVRGLERMLGEEARYPEAVRRRLKGELRASTPELERHLTPEDARIVHAAAGSL